MFIIQTERYHHQSCDLQQEKKYIYLPNYIYYLKLCCAIVMFSGDSGLMISLSCFSPVPFSATVWQACSILNAVMCFLISLHAALCVSPFTQCFSRCCDTYSIVRIYYCVLCCLSALYIFFVCITQHARSTQCQFCWLWVKCEQIAEAEWALTPPAL